MIELLHTSTKFWSISIKHFYKDKIYIDDKQLVSNNFKPI